MHCSPPVRIGLALLLTSLTASAQNFVDLDFSQNVQPNNAIYPNQSTLGPEYFSGYTFDFVNVAFVNGLAVDARVTVTGVSEGYDFVGYIPDYNQATGGPEGDLGVYYRSELGNQQEVTGGISYTISFYQSGSNFTTSQTLSDIRFLIYDHDGETGQSESIRTYAADGFTGYQIGNVSGIHVHDEGDSYRFDARGAGHPEDNADGGFIAYYHETSSIRFDMFSTTSPTLPGANNGIFGAFDGDLSLIGGNTSGFGTFVPVPEPSVNLLTAAAASLAMLRRSRPRG
jgi:hypothetical protein